MMLPNQPPTQQAGEYQLPHEDVVLYAIVYAANKKGVHPYSLAQGIARRPAFMHWLAQNTAAMHYIAMRAFIEKLVNEYGFTFDANGFTAPGERYRRVRGLPPPTIIANPSAL